MVAIFRLVARLLAAELFFALAALPTGLDVFFVAAVVVLAFVVVVDVSSAAHVRTRQEPRAKARAAAIPTALKPFHDRWIFTIGPHDRKGGFCRATNIVLVPR